MKHLLLFDGACAVCDGTVQWLLDHDPDGRLHYAPLGGPTAAAVLARHPELKTLDSLIYVEAPGTAEERVAVHSDAVLSVARLLRAPWRWVAAATVLPRALRDGGYRRFAANRYRWFGRNDRCRVPTPATAQRFHP